MSMKKLLSSLKKKDSEDANFNNEDSRSITSRTSRASISNKSQSSSIKNEESDVLNELPLPKREPSISYRESAPSVSNYSSSAYSDSLFSKDKRTLSTRSSLTPSGQKQIHDIGKPLRVLHSFSEIQEEPETSSENNFNVTMEFIEENLKNLFDNLSLVIDQLSNSVLDLSKASFSISDFFKRFNIVNTNPSVHINTNTSAYLRRIIKIYLHFVDNLLNVPVFSQSKALMLKNFHDFVNKLNCPEINEVSLTNVDDSHSLYGTVLQPKLFAIGAIDKLPNQEKIVQIMSKISQYDDSRFSEQDGSFIAPVLRGIKEKFSIITLVFGFPEPTANHFEYTKILFSLYPEIHFTVQKNLIKKCAVTPREIRKTPKINGFKPPFRIPNDFQQPPISLSLATESSLNLSGTLGGYVYPKISASDKNLKSYAGSVFGVTCGHVVLNENINQNESNPHSNPYPHVSVPSPVLINLYRKALLNEYSKYNENSEERIAYSYVIKQIDELFPRDDVLGKNLPFEKFGQIVWGERTIISNSNLSNKVSDLAIIKINKNIKCLNYLGDDVPFSEFDPSLMFKNLYIKSVINDLDTKQGLKVFKYGSTSKFTQGLFNGPKLLYWADGKIQSSEFVVAADGPSTMFAAGGDSGAWILTKLEEVSKLNKKNNKETQLSEPTSKSGLGVVGMLHSYDGEFKQFGLFTSMTDILARLESVTNTEWGVVGVEDKGDQLEFSEDESDETSGDSGDDDSNVSDHSVSDLLAGVSTDDID